MDMNSDEAIQGFHRYPPTRLTSREEQEFLDKQPCTRGQANRIEQKVDRLTQVMQDLLTALGEDTVEEPDLRTLDGHSAGAEREEGTPL